MIRVITIAREHGSGGHEIAQRVAAELGWQLVDERIVNDVAKTARAASAGLAQPVAAEVVDADWIAALTRQVIEEAGARGSCVIVGRGAQCALAGRDDVLRVFVYAPLEARRARLVSRLPLGVEPLGEIAKLDRTRAAYVENYYGRQWDDRRCYELMIDSSRGVERAVRVILQAARPPESAQPPEPPR